MVLHAHIEGKRSVEIVHVKFGDQLGCSRRLLCGRVTSSSYIADSASRYASPATLGGLPKSGSGQSYPAACSAAPALAPEPRAPAAVPQAAAGWLPKRRPDGTPPL